MTEQELWLMAVGYRGTSPEEIALVREQMQEQRRGYLRSLSDDLNPTGIKLLQWALRGAVGEMKADRWAIGEWCDAADQYVRSL